ncbi:MAG TPA: hybrid sensor histidine kinase/response regulator [Tahibacter sp.]|uniref:hybrid sensor histidine kinase/response regulator n=1 Tax=Tahibacter sp. TaxID=2056211 RepID=UPI002BDC0BFC|nr:hybrid sensor histidine kinase/response regulator [Tahibacter sp.]HSX61789.1 hybrid sensor histidine kinase/response regulator [Tahibacter sp.]
MNLPESPVPLPSQERVKCLIVDDLEENLLALSALLDSLDVELLQARSGAEALELLLVHDVALALLDVQMPQMDGFELAELMRGSERSRHVPIIFLTAGLSDTRRQFKGYGSGAVDFLHKPIEPFVLRSKAEVFFQLYRQKRQLAHELEQRTKTLQLNEMFVAVLGHDLRNPLSAMIFAGSILQRSADAATRNSADLIVQTGWRMNRMIADLLDLARARLAGGIAITVEEADLGIIATRIKSEREVMAPRRELALALSGNLRGMWDGDRLEQALSNLIGNAVEHGQPDTPIEIALDGGEPDRVRLRVSNVGVIPEDVLPALFTPFRDGRYRGRGDGLGLGLYIVKQIVDAHAGEVEARCEDGRTVFEVILPRISAGATRR